MSLPRSLTSLAFLLFILFLFSPRGLFAQSNGGLPSPPEPESVGPSSDTITADWEYEVMGKFSASQAAYKDWKEGGGINSLAFTASLEGTAERTGYHWAQSHALRFVLGFLDQEDQELRKSEDLARLQSALRYRGDGFFRVFNPTLSANLRTQFANGFNYTRNPYPGPGDHPEYPAGHPRADEEAPVQTSRFFAPATLTESLGLTYDPSETLEVRLGAASKQTIVTEPDYRVLYGVDPGKLARVEAGTEFASSFDQQLTENIRYRGRLNLLFSFNQTEDPPDMIWENVVNLQVNDWLSTDFEFVALYDEDTTEAIQIKEVISVGVSFSLL